MNESFELSRIASSLANISFWLFLIALLQLMRLFKVEGS